MATGQQKPTSSAVAVNIRGPPNADFVLGYPGINATNPRIAGVVEVRAPHGVPFKLASVSLQLYLTEVVGKQQESYRIHNQLVIYDPTTIGTGTNNSSKALLAIDLPFIYPLPSSSAKLPSTISGDDIVNARYSLYATVVETNGVTTHMYRPIAITRYDGILAYMPIKSVPYVATLPDQNVQVHLTLTNGQCYGPGDMLELDVFARDTRTGGSVSRLSSISWTVEEYITFGENSKLDPRSTKLVESSKPCERGGGVRFNATFSFDVKNSNSDRFVDAGDGQGHPVGLRTRFTNSGNNFAINYYFTVRLRIASTDYEIKNRLHVMPLGKAVREIIYESLDEADIGAKMEAAAPHREYFAVVPGDQVGLRKLGVTDANASRFLQLSLS
ncbi:uncharacterized protein V1518DRAFT_426453 [Limtongia smithiae]|uniref:uncharacterized protein n=1 Tax=Limtongia smithiae TaxID=1125753 RepID=UPI0034CD14E5